MRSSKFLIHTHRMDEFCGHVLNAVISNSWKIVGFGEISRLMKKQFLGSRKQLFCKVTHIN